MEISWIVLILQFLCKCAIVYYILVTLIQPPTMMMPNMMPPHMMAQFGMGMPMMPQQFIPMMPHQMMQARPLFPAAAAATSNVGQHQMAPKPTFPAYR